MESVFIQLGESPAFDLGPDLTTCLETQVILDATPSNVDPALVTYQWFQDGTEIVGETMATLEIIDFGTYQVLADNEGCTSSDSITISSENLTVSLPEGFQTCPDESQTLVASTDEAGVTFQWFLNGDPLVGETNPTLDISIAPEVLGEQIYEVQITRGVCTGAAQIPITLYDVGNCTISQGISPDGSPGLNDTLDLRFLADRSGIEILQIYNRLGRLVFEQESYTNEWRGQTDLSGELLPTGTYFYVIDFTSEDPEYGSQATGWIYLNRANEE
jgi:gliding motility-associated-like protein